MKKSLFAILMTLVSVQGFAQIQRTAEFDFSNPLGLNPAITPPSGNNAEINITDKTFTNKDITIDFDLGNQGLGSTIYHFTNIWTGVSTYYLRVCQQANLKVHAPKDAQLERVSFSDGSSVGDLRVDDEELGTQTDGYRTWINSDGLPIHDLIYKNSFSPAQIEKITVYYTVPSAVLDATSDIADGSVIDAFNQLHLTFDHAMTVKDGSKITISDGTNSQNLKATIQNNVVTLVASTPIAKDGDYTITVPARSFKDKNGFENKEIKIKVIIKVPFNYVSVTPEQGNILTLPLTITADFGKTVGFVDETANIRLLKNGEPYLSVKAAKVDETKVNFNIQNRTEPITDKAIYTLVVPAKVVYNGMKGDTELERSNSAFELKYVIDDSEILKKAKSLVANKNVGYPAETSAAYVALKELVQGEPTDEEVSKALKAYYAEKKIILPASQKWYHIANVNAENRKLYLGVVDNKLSLVEDEAKAMAFEATNNNGIVCLKNADDKMLTISGLVEDATSKEVNLTIAKLDPAQVKLEEGAEYDAEKMLGSLSIYGVCQNSLGEEMPAYALANHEKGLYQTDASIAVPYYQHKLSSAFVFTETDMPAEAIKTVNTAYSLESYIVVDNTVPLVLTFDELDKAVVAKDADAYIANMKDERKKDVEFAAVAGKNNQFTISLKDLAKGDYWLVIPEGTFHYELDGKEVKTQAIKAFFTIGKNGSPDDAGINFTYTAIQISPEVNGPVKDTDLNNVLIKNYSGLYDGIVANKDRIVRIAVFDNNATVRTGHMEEYVDPYDPTTPTLKLVLDTPIESGDLSPKQYALVFEQGTYGDRNFGTFLMDKTLVSASSCVANPRTVIPVDVNNTTGITDVELGNGAKNEFIYDLYGRKVTKINQPGIYIVNGKKVIKK